MSIIIEGCDLAGKTTLCWKIARELGIQHHHHNTRGPNQNVLGLAKAETPGVWDRWWPTEYVYRMAEGEPSDLNLTALWSMNLLAERHGCVYVQLEPSDEKLASRYSERGERHPLEYVVIVNYQYQLHAPKWWDMLPWARLVNPRMLEIHRYYLHQQARVAAYPGHGVGTLQEGKVLFVGDQISVRRGVSDDKPFISVYHRASCKILYTLLHGAGLRPSSVHICNAYSRRDTPLLDVQTYDYLKPRRVIALGEKANARCAALGIPVHGKLPHPSRSHSYDADSIGQWTQTLKEMLL